MSRLLLPAPADLKSLIWYLEVRENPGGEVMMPAMPFSTVGIFRSGGMQYRFDGEWQPTPQAFFVGPLSRQAHIRALPDTTLISAVLWPGRQSRICSVPGGLLTDQVLDLSALFGAEVARLASDLLPGKTGLQWSQALANWLRRQAWRAEEAAAPALFLPEPILASGNVVELAASAGLGVRQFERRFLASYGLSFQASRRQRRYMRALNLLSAQQDWRGRLAELALDSGYYDQSQMTRDFAGLLGLSPGQLLSQRDRQEGFWRLLQADAAIPEQIGHIASEFGIHAPVV